MPGPQYFKDDRAWIISHGMPHNFCRGNTKLLPRVSPFLDCRPGYQTGLATSYRFNAAVDTCLFLIYYYKCNAK